MKRFLLALGLLLTAATTFAQDVIVKKNNETILCRVIQTTDTHVIYKNWSDLDGQSLAIERSQISAINYQNGKKETMAPITENQYAPNNQNNGMGQYNDMALLNMDLKNRYNDLERKAKVWKTVGWTGVVCAALGAVTALTVDESEASESDIDAAHIGGAVLGVVGIVGSVIGFTKAHKYKKIAQGYVQASPLFYQQFNIGNDKSLLAGVDVIKDDFTHQRTLGLGLRMNF